MKKIVLILFLFCLHCFAIDDFANVLNYAKFSSCENIAYKFDTLSKFNGFGKLIEKELNTKKENLFPWRFEITNGYKEGFFYYALLGYANELSGDIPFAYQCYRNATLYINEEKSFNFPEPTAEIYLGIARTCLAAGRYMDAKDWLDAAYEYANNNPNILAAIDRVAIKKGNELGDYENIILHYQHLEQVSSSRPGRSSSKCEQKSPLERGARQGGVCSLTKSELANYAQILFWSRKDRKGFSKLLEGISKLGIDNNRGVKDPLVNKFLNNIMRADNEEVEYFYDLLGYEIEAARAKAGDENYLAFLCNTRTLFCKVYDFLDPKNDLEKVKKRIDKVKEQLKQGCDVFGKNSKSVNRNPWSGKKKKIIKTQNRKISKTGIAEELQEVELENLLMKADWYRLNSKDKLAYEYYIRAQNMITNAIFSNSYDYVSVEFAMQSGIAFFSHKLLYVAHRYSPPIKKPENEIKKVFDLPYDNSLRHLQTYCLSPSYAIKYGLIETILENAPRAFPPIQKLLGVIMDNHCKKENYESAFKVFEDTKKRSSLISTRIYGRLGTAYIELDKTEKAFDAFFKNIIQYPTHARLLSPCLDNTWWLDKTLIGYYTNIACQMEMVFAIKATYDKSNWKWAKAWQDFRKKMASQLSNDFESKPYNEISPYNSLSLEQTKDFLNISDTNGAVQLCLDSLKSRYNIIYNFSRSFKLKFPNKESEIVEKYFDKVTPELQKEYIKFISKSKHSSAKEHLAVFLNNNPKFKQK